MVRLPLGPLTVRVAPASRLTEAIGGGTATTVPLWTMLPFGSGNMLMVQAFTGKMPSAVIEDAGRFSPMKVADPVSCLVVLMAFVFAFTAMPMPRLSAIAPNLTFGLPVSCCVSAAGRVEGIGVQAAPLGSMERLARLLTMLPICTATGMKHPVTPGGIVNWMTSQAAIPSGAGKFGSSPLQQRPRPAETTVPGTVPT